MCWRQFHLKFIWGSSCELHGCLLSQRQCLHLKQWWKTEEHNVEEMAQTKAKKVANKDVSNDNTHCPTSQVAEHGCHTIPPELQIWHRHWQHDTRHPSHPKWWNWSGLCDITRAISQTRFVVHMTMFSVIWRGYWQSYTFFHVTSADYYMLGPSSRWKRALVWSNLKIK